MLVERQRSTPRWLHATLAKLVRGGACLALCTASTAFLLSADTALAQSAEEHRAAISALLDDFHLAAAEADRDRYLGHFAPGGVFMGTDDWERWPLQEFEQYVDERFAGGTGWSYSPEDRHIMFAGAGMLADDELDAKAPASQAQTAWFDEIMVSPRWGRYRGTGVLLLINGDWKIAHYSLTALVPNERFQDVAAITKAGFADREKE